MSNEPQSEVLECPGIESVRVVVEHHFPNLWPAVDAGLAVAATLLLRANANPTALIYMGGPSGGKTTAADMFADEDTTVRNGEREHPLFYVSDTFTPASFVSQAASRTKEQLDKVDLLPRIRHKVMVTPELAPLFRGKQDDLVRSFKIITRVLDGHGLMTDGGVQGRRGYRGDYLFAWLGATTPFDPLVWQVMGQLGSRLFFLVVAGQGEDVTVEMLLDGDDGASYAERLATCRAIVQSYLGELFSRHDGIRSVSWDAAKDPRPVRLWIARCSMLLAAMRSEPTREAKPDDEGAGYVPEKREGPHRALAVLTNLARGHALVHDRQQLAEDDLPLVAQVTVSSMPSECGRVIAALVANGGEPLVVSDVRMALDARHPETARKVMLDLDHRGLVEFVTEGEGRAAFIRVRPEWEWLASPEFAGYLLREPVTEREVCASPITTDLAKDEGGEERREVGTHTPGEVTGAQAVAA